MEINILAKPNIQDRRQARNRSIRRALLSTVPARMSGVLLQVVSLPVAAMQLGTAGFSVYAMLGTLLAAMTLSNLGIGQATTLHMARALADGKAQIGRELLLASLIVIGCIAISVSAMAALLILTTPLLPFIFSQYLDAIPVPTAASLFVCFVFLATQLLSVFEAAQLAQQRQHRLNIAIGIGTFIAAAAVWVTANERPNVLNIMIAMHLPVIIARTLNAIAVWVNISPRFQNLEGARNHMRDVMQDGVRFVTGTTVANFLCHPFSVLAVGLFSIPLVSASFAAVMNAIILASSVNSLVVTPFRGAIPEAFRNGDHTWLNKAVTNMFGVSVVYGLFICIIFAATGQWLFDTWYGGAVAPERIELVGAGLYFLVLSIEVTSFTYLSNTGLLPAASRLMLVKAIFSAIAVMGGAYVGYSTYVFWILLANNILLSLIPLTTMSIRGLRKVDKL